MEKTIAYIIIGIAICVLIFMATREFWCWYFKINRNNELLEQILNEIKKMNNSSSNEKVDDIYFANKIQINKKNEETKTKDDENNAPEETVEDPFSN